MEDEDIFGGKTILPNISMEVDNDEDSEWIQIRENMRMLTGSLQAALQAR
jgi:hypothetical protein